MQHTHSKPKNRWLFRLPIPGRASFAAAGARKFKSARRRPNAVVGAFARFRPSSFVTVMSHFWAKQTWLWLPARFVRKRPWLFGTIVSCLAILALFLAIEPQPMTDGPPRDQFMFVGTAKQTRQLREKGRDYERAASLRRLGTRPAGARRSGRRSNVFYDRNQLFSGRDLNAPFFAPSHANKNSAKTVESVDADSTDLPAARGAWLTGTIEELMEPDASATTAEATRGAPSRR